MKKKLASAVTASALALTAVAVAPEATAAPARVFTPPIAHTPAETNNIPEPATNAKKDTPDFSSEVGDVVVLLALIAVLMSIYGYSSPYYPNGAWADAAR